MPNSSLLHASSTPLQHVHSHHHTTIPSSAAQAAAIEASAKFNKEGLVAAHWDALHDAHVLEKGLHPVDGPLPEQPSPMISPNSLKPILIKDLKLGKVHKARALNGTLCTKSLKIQSVVNVLEDETGLATKLVICNALPVTYSMLQAQRLYPEGAKVAVLEPYLAEFADGTIGLLVEKPSNVIFLWVPDYVSDEESSDKAKQSSPRKSVEEEIDNGKSISRNLKSLSAHGTDLDRKQASGLNHGENGASPIKSAENRVETNPEYAGKAILNELQTGDRLESKESSLTLVADKIQPVKESLNESQTHTANGLQSGDGVKLEKGNANEFPDAHESQATQDSSGVQNLIANGGASLKSDGESEKRQEGQYAMIASVDGQSLISERGEIKNKACIANGSTDREGFISDSEVTKEACIGNGSDDRNQALISKKEVKKESCIINGSRSGEVDSSGDSPRLEPQMKQEPCTESTATAAPISELEIKQEACCAPKKIVNVVDSSLEILPGSPLMLKPAERKTQNRPQESNNDFERFKPMEASSILEVDLIKPDVTREHFASGSEIDGKKVEKDVHASNGAIPIQGTRSELMKIDKDGCNFYSESSKSALLKDAEETFQHGRENAIDGLDAGKALRSEIFIKSIIDDNGENGDGSDEVETRNKTDSTLTSVESDRVVLETGLLHCSGNCGSNVISESASSKSPLMDSVESMIQYKKEEMNGLQYHEASTAGHDYESQKLAKEDGLQNRNGIQVERVGKDVLGNIDTNEALLESELDKGLPLELSHNDSFCKTESSFLASIVSEPGIEQEKNVEIEQLLLFEPNSGTNPQEESERNRNNSSSNKRATEQTQCEDQEHSMRLQVDQSQEGNGLQQHQPIRLMEKVDTLSELAATSKELPNSEMNAANEELTAAPIDPLYELSAASLRIQGNSRFAETDWYGAAELYTQAILRIESSKQQATESWIATGSDEVILCYSNRSEAWLRLHLHENARTDAEHALGRDPTHVKSLFRMGRALLGLRRPSEAQPFLEDARKRAPEDKELHQTLRLCRMMKQQNYKQKLKRNL